MKAIQMQDKYSEALDRLIDNKLICNRVDALKVVLFEYDKNHPGFIADIPVIKK